MTACDCGVFQAANWVFTRRSTENPVRLALAVVVSMGQNDTRRQVAIGATHSLLSMVSALVACDPKGTSLLRPFRREAFEMRG